MEKSPLAFLGLKFQHLTLSSNCLNLIIFYFYTPWSVSEYSSRLQEIWIQILLREWGFCMYPKASLRRNSTLDFTAIKVTALENPGHFFFFFWIFHLPNLTGVLLVSRLTCNHTVEGSSGKYHSRLLPCRREDALTGGCGGDDLELPTDKDAQTFVRWTSLR